MGLGITLRPIHNQAGWVDQAVVGAGDVVASCQRVESCHSTVVRLAQGCQSGWRVSEGASQDEESIRLPRRVPDGWGRSNLGVGV